MFGIPTATIAEGPHRIGDIDLARRSIAAALTSPRIVVSHLGVAELYRWPVWAPQPRSCVVVDDGRSRAPGAHVHRTPIRIDSVELDGFRITRPSRSVLDIACEFGTEAGLVVADAAVAQGLTTADRLQYHVGASRGRTGIEAARPLPSLVDGRSESPLESRSRWQCVLHDLPLPEPQVRLHDTAGRFLGRVDLWWDVGVVGEVDGAGKLMEAGARKALLERQLRLGRAGLRIVRFGEADLRSFAPIAAWIREELAAAEADRRRPLWRVAPSAG